MPVSIPTTATAATTVTSETIHPTRHTQQAVGNTSDDCNDDVDNDKSSSQSNHSSSGSINADETRERQIEGKTCFDDPSNYDVHHPTIGNWVLMFDLRANKNSNTNQNAWYDQMKKIQTIQSLEDYWGCINNIIPATDLSVGGNFHMFREGIKPGWEDPENAKGGRWLITFPKNAGGQQNSFWLKTTMAIVCGAFGELDKDICGVVFSPRRVDKICLWTKSGSDEELTKQIGEKWKQILNYKSIIFYQLHAIESQPAGAYQSNGTYSI